MKIFYKYKIVESSTTATPYRDHHEELAGNTDIDFPKTKEEFFDKFLYQFHGGRTAALDRLCKSMIVEKNILSVASGNFAVELKYEELSGCNIVCSDQYAPRWLEQTKKLFPNLKFTEIDVLSDVPKFQYDAILAFSLIYLFNNKDLGAFFKFSYDSLHSDGRLYLDVSSAETTSGSIFHNFFIPIESNIIALFKSFRHGRRFKVIKTMHGWHHNEQELIRIALDNSLEFVDKKVDGFDVDFARSPLLQRLAKYKFGRYFLNLIGRAMPFNVILIFRKKSIKI